MPQRTGAHSFASLSFASRPQSVRNLFTSPRYDAR